MWINRVTFRVRKVRAGGPGRGGTLQQRSEPVGMPDNKLRTLSRAMTAIATHTEVKYLTDGAKAELEACGEWLRKEAKFEPFSSISGEYDVCVDNDRLAEISGPFMKHFQSSMKDSETVDEIRITAIRFNHRATVPMKPGSYVDLIPVSIISGTPSISSKGLELGQYVHLEEATQVEPAFICLLLLSQ